MFRDGKEVMKKGIEYVRNESSYDGYYIGKGIYYFFESYFFVGNN